MKNISNHFNEKYMASYWLVLLLTLCSEKAMSVGSGSLAGAAVSSDATVCFSIGVYASLTGLDDFVLTPMGADGGNGSLYSGKDVFHLQSNGPVRVRATGSGLYNGDMHIETIYQIDSGGSLMDTTPLQTHQGNHTLHAMAILGRISDQAAGEYAGQVTLTVTPQINEVGGTCSLAVTTYPFVGDEGGDAWATMAFEDLYPNPGDADYNDMVVKFNISESYNEQNNLESMHLEFVPLARGAGYNHELLLSLDGVLGDSRNVTTQTAAAFVGDAEVKVTRLNLHNNTGVVSYYNPWEDLSLFRNTRATLEGFANVSAGADYVEPKIKTMVDITIAAPTLNPYEDRLAPSLPPYRPFLHVKNTGNDIDIAAVNSADGMIDSNGYPFGVVVPEEWAWPLEQVNINDVYPYFAEYRQWLNGEITSPSEEALHWYDYPADDADGKIFDRDLFN